ncbi:transcriptional regulator with XRE-family HTH domain [Salirhabdus euzebyi]|uniref:Transcriptional regulator with XRE-family HTH domain n=1 Tax=Salirhabdus euzebyi TaxID=394506 RepID=A0A841PYH4_9BACI|nr:helix-turn-helix transcriptional regulator [Salirhabdus euzebyi]MBB6452021.1 transcriptional regulator with XRE-family HTH domain [Salirhabdus euzebyi]
MAYIVGRCLLRELLRNKDMTQVDLAARLGVTFQQVNKYANNRQLMSIKVAKNIAAILNCHIDDLYEWIEAGEKQVD